MAVRVNASGGKGGSANSCVAVPGTQRVVGNLPIMLGLHVYTVLDLLIQQAFTKYQGSVTYVFDKCDGIYCQRCRI